MANGILNIYLPVNGTAVAADTLARQHIIGTSKDTGWYAFAEITISNNLSRTYDILIDSTYHSSSADESSRYESGVLRIYCSRSTNGAVTQNVCWLTTTFRIDDVRSVVETISSTQSKMTLYIYKSANTSGALVFRLLSSADREGDSISSLTWLSTAAEVPASARTATYMLNSSYYLTGASGWYKFLDITLGNNNARTMTLLIDSSYAIPTPMGSGIVRIYYNRQANGTANVGVRLLASHFPADWLRYSYSNGTVSLYIYKSTNESGGISFRALSCTDRTGKSVFLGSFSWQSVSVEEPTSATIADDYIESHARAADYDGNGNNIADGVLLFSSVVVSAGTAQQLMSISNAKITADYVLDRIEFADPAYITTSYSWTTSAGSFTLTGTATAATTANVLFIRKGN